MIREARDLTVGDVFRLHVYGEVLSVTTIGNRIKVKLELENQGRRDNCGGPTGNEKQKADKLEFTDDGYVLEFICRPSRTFHLIERWDGDDDGFEGEPSPCSDPGDKITA
jgi:hypothetical protein